MASLSWVDLCVTYRSFGLLPHPKPWLISTQTVFQCPTMFSFLGMLGLGHFGWFAGELVLVYPHGRASGRLQHEVATSVTSKRMGFVECFPRDLVLLMILEALAVGLSSTRGPRRSCGEIHLEAFRPDGFLGRTRAGGLLPTYELWVTLHGGNGRWQQVGDVTSWLRRSILVRLLGCLEER